MNQSCSFRYVSIILLLAALCGVFSAPPTQADEDVRRATPPPGKALVFVFRADRVPLTAQVRVIVNSVLVGELANGTFITATVGPGRNYLRVGDGVPSTLELAPGQTFFVRIRALGDPQSPRTEVHLVSEAEGRRSLAQSRFAGAAPAATALSLQPPPAPDSSASPPKPPPPAATQPPAGQDMSLPAESGRDWDLALIALIANAGTFKMANGNQLVAGLPTSYDTSSETVVGFAAEWRRKAGVAVGGEVFHYMNDLVSSGTIPDAQQEVFAIMVNGKYYFRLANSFYPFVGAGVGHATASYSGGLKGRATGLAYQALAGIEFRFNQIAINVQYKHLDATTGYSGKDVKVGGSGILAGVSFLF